MSKTNILVVDDDSDVAELIKAVMEMDEPFYVGNFG